MAYGRLTELGEYTHLATENKRDCAQCVYGLNRNQASQYELYCDKDRDDEEDLTEKTCVVLTGHRAGDCSQSPLVAVERK